MNSNIKETTTLPSEKLYGEIDPHFINYFPSAVLLLDKNLVITNANIYAESMLGETKSLIGKNIAELISENRSKEIIALLEKSFTNSKPSTLELKIKTSENIFLDAMSMFHSCKDEIHGEKFLVFAMLDFTPHKMREEIIKDSEARFKNMANTAPVMIWISDVDGLFSFVNNVWLEYSGGEMGSQLGMNWLNQVHTNDLHELLRMYQTALRNKESFSVELKLKNKNGEYEWMLLKGKPRFNSGNMFIGFIGSCINIQAQKEIETKISSLNEELVQTIATRDKFFSIISHDLRSPLGGLMGILDILNSSFNSLVDSEKKEIIGNAAQVSKSTYTLMENLLEWSRIQTGTIRFEPENLNLYRLVENVAALYEQNINAKRINFYNNTNSEIYIHADKSMAEAILRNLISNAIKFTNKDGTITISSKHENGMVIIEVKDNGIGIDKNTIEKLFRVDVSVSTKGTEKETGSGLGLIISKEFAEKQQGKIWIESKKDEGSKFYFSVPVSS